MILPLLLFYGMVNLTVSELNGQPVYPPLDPIKDGPWLFLAVGLGLAGALGLVFMFWEWLAEWKRKVYWAQT